MPAGRGYAGRGSPGGGTATSLHQLLTHFQKQRSVHRGLCFDGAIFNTVDTERNSKHLRLWNFPKPFLSEGCTSCVFILQETKEAPEGWGCQMDLANSR